MQLNAGQINSKSHLHSWMSKQKSAMTELLKKEVLVRILRPLSVLMPSPDSFQPSWLSQPAKASILYSSTRVRVVADTVQLRFSLSKTASPTRCQCALICAPLKQGLLVQKFWTHMGVHNIILSILSMFECLSYDYVCLMIIKCECVAMYI